jgi:SAM-dependent methyltransferase
MAEQPTFFDAYYGVLRPLVGAHGLVHLLQGAQAAGLLAALREPATTDQLVAATGLPRRRVRAVCGALVVHDVVEPVGDGHRLTAAWRTLLAPDAYVSLADGLDSARIEGALLRDVAAGSDYWTMSSGDRQIFARAVSPNPFAPGLVAAFRDALEHDPTAAALATGGTLLELGCGVAGRVLTMLQALPRMRAVGVELSEDLAEEARRRAEVLGVTDRFEVVCSDAGAFSRAGAFDVGFWSQFFFPDHARRAALETMFRSVRPGGFALAPLLGDDESVRNDPRGAEARDLSVLRVILDGWGVPHRDRDQLAAEFVEAGFTDVHFVGGGSAGPVRLVARRP